VKLKRLIIHGFKSFKDRTTIHFDDGITGIVGPNGCGKSNIVDALFWVMGEQSAKHLRGSSMKDVIFSGSSKYSPGAWAEVSLVLANETGKHIHIGNKVSNPEEIQLTRKLYRNGETEYRINGTPCRLKDIQEVFMDTGAGAKSYSIIAQGEIDRLVKAKPEERRVMIEEVAGITKFKVRKRESVRKIEQTEANLNRLQDLQQEIDKNLKTLKSQAEKAEKAKRLKEQVEKNELIVASHQEHEILTNYRESKNSLNGLNVNVVEWRAQKQNLEISLEQERILREELVEKIDVYQAEYNKLSNELAAAEERLNSLKRSIDEQNKLINLRTKDGEELAKDLEDRSKRLEQLKDEHKKLLEFSEEDHDYSGLEVKVSELKRELESKELLLKKLADSLGQHQKDFISIEQKIFNNNSRVEEISNNLQDTTQEIEALEDRYSGVSSELREEREQLNTLENRKVELAAKESTSKQEIQSLKDEFAQIDVKARDARKEMIQIESKLVSLQEINASLEGVKEGAAAFLRSGECDGHQILGNLVKCEDVYTGAVQAALEGLSDLLIPVGATYDKFVTWIKSHRQHGADLLLPTTERQVVSSEVAQRLELSGCEGVKSFKDITHVSAEYKSIVEKLFDGFYVVENLDEALATTLCDIQFKTIVSLSGDVVVRNLGFGKVMTVFGSESPKQGIIARNNKIEELQSHLEVSREKVQTLEHNVAEKKTLIDEKLAAYDELRNHLADANARFAAKKSALDSKVSSFEESSSRLEILKNRKQALSKQKLELLEVDETNCRNRDALAVQIKDLDVEVAGLKHHIDELRSSYNRDKEVLLEKQVAVKTFKDRLSSVERQLADVEGQLSRISEKIESNKTQISEGVREVETISTTREELAESNKLRVDDLRNQSGALGSAKEELNQLNAGMQDREDRVKSLTADINKSEKRSVEYEIRLGQFLTEEDQVVRDTFEKYRVDLRKTLAEFLQYSSEDIAELNDVSSMYFMESDEGRINLEAKPYEFVRRFGKDLVKCKENFKQYRMEPVSYTHLTLPTIYSV